MKNNYHITRLFKAIIVLLAVLLPVLASAQVDVRVMILPPYSSKLSDYLSRPQQFILTVHNTTSVNQNVQLRGEFSGDNGVSIKANANYKSSVPIRLGPNELRTLGINDISSLFDINKVTFTGITKQQFITQNGVPEGNYQICVQAFDYNTNKPLSDSSPSGCSNIIPVTSVEDPTVIAPFDGNTVSALAGQNFVISWSTPSGAPPSTQYTIKIAEIFGSKSPADAFNTSMVPIFYQQTVTGTNSIVYNQAMPAMTLGRHYALAITANDPSNTVTFKNKGQSVVTSFIYGDTTAVAAPLPPKAVTAKTIGRLPGFPIIIGTPIPASTIVGNIQWYFEKSEENAPSGRVPVTNSIPNPAPGTIAHPVANSKVTVTIIPVYEHVAASKVPGIPKKPGSGKLSLAQLDQETDLQDALNDQVYQGGVGAVTTDANGNFQYNVAGILEAIGANPPKIMKELGMGRCDSLRVIISGNELSADHYTHVNFGGKAFSFPIAALTAGIEVGTIQVTAGTMRFKGVATGADGKELTDATINLYRRSDYYQDNPQLQYEGNFNANAIARTEVNINGVMYTKVASLLSGYTATRLFFPTQDDEYLVQVAEGDYTPLTTTLSARTDTMMSVTVQRHFALGNQPIVLAGNVTQTLNGVQVPAQGAVVTMMNYTRLFTATTDANGNFQMINGMNIVQPFFGQYGPIMPTGPQQFIVAYKGQATTGNVNIDSFGKTYNVSATINVSTFPVSGKIVDASGNAIPNPVIRWQSTGAAVNTDAQGNFNTTNVVGTDSLIISKLSYADKHLGVIVRSDGTVIAGPPPAPPAPRGRSILYSRAPGAGLGGILNAVNGVIGNVELDKNFGKVNVIVTDYSGNAIAGALVNLDNDPLPQDAVTDNNGLATIIGPSGDLLFDVKGPAGTTYVPRQVDYDIPGNGITSNVRVPLQSGILVSGKVTANGAAVAGATVGATGQDYGTATTQNDGSYSIITPVGNYSLEATKQGYLAAIKPGNFVSNQTLNFALNTSSLNITKLLGFNVEVDEIKNNGGTKLITGEFINIPSNAIFSVAANTKLKFYDVAVTVQADGTVVPVDDFITTGASQLNIKAFNYLPLTLTNDGDDDHNDVVYVAKLAGGKHGQIVGKPGISFGSFVPAGVAPYMADGLSTTWNQSTSKDVPVLTDDGSLSGSTALNFINADNPVFNIYGFKLTIDVANSSIQKDGIHLAGNIDLSAISVLSGTNLNVQALIGTDGSVTSVTAQPNIKLNIAGWAGNINSLSFNENGFSLGGNLAIQLPGTSGVSNLNFSNLQISKDMLYGGNFSLPSGINVFGVATVTGSNLSFGKLGNTNTYYLSGGGTIDFSRGPAGSFLDAVALDHFQVQTDGKLAVSAHVGSSNSFFGGVAKVAINQVSFSDLNDQTSIDVLGQFSLTIPGFSGSAGGIHIRNGGVSVDNLGVGFDIPGIGTANVNVGFMNTPQKKGFSGSGAFNIMDLASIAVGFEYYKVPGGFDLAASLSSSLRIPLGSSGLFITQVGGGFGLNTGQKTWDIDINGTVSVFDPNLGSVHVDVNVAGSPKGPTIKGTAALSLATLNLANGTVLIDVPNKLFSVDIAAGLSMSGVSAKAGGRMVLSLDPGDKYFLAGAYVDVKLLSLLNLNGNMLLAYNLNTGKHRSDLSDYLTAIPDFDRNAGQIFTGVSTSSSFYVSLDDMLPNFDVDLWLVSIGVHSYFHAWANGYMTAGLVNSSPTFAVGLGVGWEMGGNVEFKALGFIDWNAGLAIGFNASFNGQVSMNPANITMDARAGAYLHAYMGDIDPRDCESGTNIPWYKPSHWWVSVCLQPTIDVSYSTNKGFGISF